MTGASARCGSALALAAVLAGAPAQADPAADPFADAARAAAPDPAYGAYLATQCVTCHPASGPAHGIPVLAGRPREALIDLIAAYRSGARAHAGMQTVAQSLDAAATASVASYLASLPPN